MRKLDDKGTRTDTDKVVPAGRSTFQVKEVPLVWGNCLICESKKKKFN